MLNTSNVWLLMAHVNTIVAHTDGQRELLASDV
jgi:hypothetical protein